MESALELDNLDHALLRALQLDARRTNRDLAAAVGVAPSTSLQRLRALRRRGVIRRFTAELDLTALGRPVQALVAVHVYPPSRAVLQPFRDWVHTVPEVMGIFITTGSDDFLLHVAVANTDELYSFVADRLTRHKEVMEVRTHIIYEHLTRRAIDASPPVSPPRNSGPA